MLADLDAGPMTRTLVNIVRLAHDVEQGRGLSPTYRLDAYLINMAVRLIELRRVLSPTGSIYLHRDDAASHYLKLLMDAIFGRQNFRNEIIWKRTYAHSDGKEGRKHPGRIHDSLLFYTKSDKWTWNTLYTPYAGSTWTSSTSMSRKGRDGAGSFGFQGLARPRMRRAAPGVQPIRRKAAAMLLSPKLRSTLTTTLRSAAITWGAAPLRT